MLKAVSSVSNTIGALNYKGTWDASTNTPALASGVGSKGDYYVVSVAGTTALDGISTWYVGDWATFNGTAWQRVEGGVDDPAPSLKSNSTTGLMQITGPAAGQTRVVTVPDANATMARTDAGQEFTGNQTVNGTLWVKDTNNLQFGYNALRATINGSDTFTFTPRSGYGVQFDAEAAIAGKIQPTVDATYTCGAAARRWSEVFADNGTINTSDARDKTEVRSLNDAEIAASKSLAKEIGAFKFLSAVSLKGDAAREHIGMTVQRSIEIMQAHGLNAFNYGFICFDKWDNQYVDVEVPEEYVDEEGKTQTRPVKTGEKRLVIAAGEKYGFRTDQLLMFIARGFEARLSALEGA